MRFSLRQVLLALLGCAILMVPAIADAAEPPAAPNEPWVSAAAPLVREALQAEAAGKIAERDALIKQALKEDDTYAPAHWHNGEIRAKDLGFVNWRSVDDAAKDLARDGKVTAYRGMNPLGKRDSDQHRKLGDWCDAAGLMPQAQMHWMNALLQKPSSRDLQQKLGVTLFRGQFLPPEIIAAVVQQEKATAAAQDKWKARIEKLRDQSNHRRASQQKAANDELSKIADPAALPALEKFSVDGGELFAESAVEAISKMPGQAATNSLLRQSVCSPYPSVRKMAALSLKDRSMFAYVPALMNVMKSPILIKAEMGVDLITGQEVHALQMFQEGPLGAQAMLSIGERSQIDVITHHPIAKRPDDKVSYVMSDTLPRDQMLARNAIAQNAQAAVWNANAAAVLRETTGEQLDDAPTSWWSWWLNYNEIYQPPQKPIEVSVQNTVPQAYRIQIERYSSCFVEGTKVWAMDGPIEIQKVQPGEWILSQDPATGRLAYKPVVGITVRPASPVRAIKIKGDTIIATRGHPFWVSGIGWQMTKELEPGKLLHTVGGATPILSADEAGEEVCYNLVVADFGNYFVGEQKVLVHDNTIRDITPALVPGLVTQK